MKAIKYTIKNTSANTEYRDIADSDKQWILTQVQELADLCKQCVNSVDSNLRVVGRELSTPNKKLIRKGTGGFNSIQSLVDGILDNMNNGTQRDFSNRTCKGLTEAFKHAAEIFSTIEEVEFVLVDKLPSSIQCMDKVDKVIATTLSELWDTQVYEVTVTRKK